MIKKRVIYPSLKPTGEGQHMFHGSHEAHGVGQTMGGREEPLAQGTVGG